MSSPLFSFHSPWCRAVIVAGVCAYLSSAAFAQQTTGESKPKFPDFVTARAAAKAKFDAKDFAGAAKDMEAALALAQTPVERGIAMVRIGQAYASAGNAAKAREWWQKTVQEPEVGAEERDQARLMISQSWMEEKQFEKAIAAAEPLLKAPNEDSRLGAVAFTAMARHKLGQYEPGRELLLNELKREDVEPGTQTFLLTTLSQIALAEKRHDEANGYLMKALAIPQPLDGAATLRMFLAMSFRQQKRFADARAVYGDIIKAPLPEKTDPAEAVRALSFKTDALMSIARCYVHEGNVAAAKESYQAVLDSPIATTEKKASARREMEALK